MELAPCDNTFFGFSSLPQSSSMPQSVLSSVAMPHNVGPPVNIVSDPPLRESPIPVQPQRHGKSRRSTRYTTPIVTQRNSRPPIRRVHPIGSSDYSESSSSHERCNRECATSKQSAPGNSRSTTAKSTLTPTASDNDSFVLPSSSDERCRGT